jgi:exopolysaccharide biosynthesis protein
MIIVSPDQLKSGGMTLDQIRDKLAADGYDNALSFDGGSSSTLIKDGKTLVAPKWFKNNSIPTGLHVSESNEKN